MGFPTTQEIIIVSLLYLTILFTIYLVVTKIFPRTKSFMAKASIVLVLLYTLTLEIAYIAY